METEPKPTRFPYITVEPDADGIPIVHVELTDCPENNGVRSAWGESVARVFVHDGEKLAVAHVRLGLNAHGRLRAKLLVGNESQDAECSAAVRPWRQ